MTIPDATGTLRASVEVWGTMTRTRWTGLVGLLFGISFFLTLVGTGSTPNSDRDDSPALYTEFWAEAGNQDKAVLGSVVMTYVFLLLLVFVAGLRARLRTVDNGPLSRIVTPAGTAAAVLLLVGFEVNKLPGFTAREDRGFELDGQTALLIESLSYQLLAPGVMALAVVAVAAAILTLRTRVLPVWTAYVGFLLGLGAVGSYYSAWTGFFLVPLWSVAVGIGLLTDKDSDNGESTAS